MGYSIRYNPQQLQPLRGKWFSCCNPRDTIYKDTMVTTTMPMNPSMMRESMMIKITPTIIVAVEVVIAMIVVVPPSP